MEYYENIHCVEGDFMGDINLYKPEFNLERDTFLGTKEVKTKKLFYLSKMAQDEQWNYSGENENKILYNYLCYTKEEKKWKKCHKRRKYDNGKGGVIMNDVMKGLLIVLVIIYVISPIDFVPGPVDDFIVILLGLASQKKIENKQ